MKAHKFLTENDIEFELVEQENPTKDCDAAARERGVETHQIVKSLIIERHCEKGDKKNTELLHVLLPGDRTISEKKFGEHHLVNPERSEKLTGFKSGTVHPFSTDIKHVLDFRVLKNDKVSFTVGEQLKGVIITTANFRKALQKSDFEYEVKDVALSDKRDIELLTARDLPEDKAQFITEHGFTHLYLQLNYKNDMIVKALEEAKRYQLRPSKSILENILEISNTLTQVQKITAYYAKNGELPQEQDEFEVHQVVEDVFSEFPSARKDLENGKGSVENFVIGKVMEKTRGEAKPEKVREILQYEY